MYIYNVTITLEPEIEAQWLNWMQQEHIPAILATKKFSGALMTRVITDQDLGGPTYSVQYRTQSKAILEQYYQEDAPKLRAASAAFAGKFVAFRTELDIITECS